MITLELTKAEALLYMEMIKRNTREMLDQIAENMDEAVTKEELSHAARQNYVTNLENEVKNLRTQLDAKTLASKPGGSKVRTLKPKAPWGYKKDGTPKKKPGIQAGF